MRLVLVDRYRARNYYWMGSPRRQVIGTGNNPIQTYVGDYWDPLAKRRYPLQVVFHNHRAELESPMMILKAITDKSNFNMAQWGYMVDPASFPPVIQRQWPKWDRDERRRFIIKLLEKEYNFDFNRLEGFERLAGDVPQVYDQDVIDAEQARDVAESLGLMKVPEEKPEKEVRKVKPEAMAALLHKDKKARIDPLVDVLDNLPPQFDMNPDGSAMCVCERRFGRLQDLKSHLRNNKDGCRDKFPDRFIELYKPAEAEQAQAALLDGSKGQAAAAAGAEEPPAASETPAADGDNTWV